MCPLAPLYTADLFAPLHHALVDVLRSLTPEDWERPTVARAWRVRDVAAHLLDVQLRTLSALRDGYLPAPTQPITTYEETVRFLNQLNADWITASQRLSPTVLLDLLATIGAQAATTLATMPPHGPALFSVAWAGASTSENWMHMGREYTEWWHHQMQIRDAVDAPGLYADQWLHPLLHFSVRVLPEAYRAVEANVGTSLVLSVENAGVWSLVYDDIGWTAYEGAPSEPTTSIHLDADTAWKSLYHALRPAEAHARARIEGRAELAAPFFFARSVMVTTDFDR